MWLIARRSFAGEWPRLVATMVAALLSVGLMSGSLQFAMRAQSAVSGSDASEYHRADVLVQGGETDPDDVYAAPDGRVRLDQVTGRPGVAAAAGDAMVPVTAAGSNGKAISPPAGARTLLRPWVADARLNPYQLESGRAPAAPNEVAVVRHVTRAGHLHVGSDLRLLLPRQTTTMKIVGVVTVQGHGAVAAGDLILGAPEAVRQAAGLPAGTWQSVWVKSSVAPDRLRADLARSLPGTTVRTAASVRHAQSADVQSAGVSIGGSIGMLAAVAVFVGIFVVANTFGTLIRQRTRRLALLSAIGATPRQIKRLIRFEALALGLVAGIAGVALGYPISSILTYLFAKDGFDISAGEVQFGWIPLLAPALGGIIVTQLAAWRAARKAARIAPMEALRDSASEDKGRRWPRLLGALAVFATAWIFYGPVFAIRYEEPPGPDRTVGTALMILMGTMVAVGSLAMLAPFFVGPLGGLVGRIGVLFSGEAGRLARASITRSPRRVSSAASSLMLGVTLAASTALMVLSAQARFDETGHQVMKADHAVAVGSKTAGTQTPLPRDTADKLARVPGVTHATALTQTQAKLVSPPPRRPSPEEDPEPVYLSITGADQADLGALLKLGGHLPALRPNEIALTTNVLRAQHIKPGQNIVVRATQGRLTLKVRAAYHDPSHLFADQALVAPSTMDRLDSSAATQAVLVKGGDSQALSHALSAIPGAKVYDRSAYIKLAKGAMTNGLQVIYGFLAMALVIAFFGMATTISMSVAERTREFGLLGAVGTTTAQIRSIVRWEAATVVLLGTLLGVGTSVGTVYFMHVASGSSFLEPNPPWWLFPLIALSATAVTLATSALPARRAAAIPVLQAAQR